MELKSKNQKEKKLLLNQLQNQLTKPLKKKNQQKNHGTK
jgi:hypothetical protein